jgi:phosphoglucomutase
MLEQITKESIHVSDLAGEKILTVLTDANGDGNAIGGVKVVAQNGWFAARPSGTEEIYKIYAESFDGEEHLHQIETEAQAIVGKALMTAVTVAEHQLVGETK